MLKSTEMRPCPFCGYEWPTITHNNCGDYWEIRCPQCDFRGSFGPASATVRYGSMEKARDKALEAWNKRASEQP